LFGGAITVTADAVRLYDSDWNGVLYRADQPEWTPTRLTAIPYYLWNNRGKGSMIVWIAEAGSRRVTEAVMISSGVKG
jgi:DUF1680 family protein